MNVHLTAREAAAAEAAAATPLDRIDVSRVALFQDDTWRPWFARLRREAPVHYLADSPHGPFWSVTSHRHIMEVDRNHVDLSSEAGGISIAGRSVDGPPPGQPQSFIASDPPGHGIQRNAVQPAVAPRNLAQLEPLIRERAADILDHLPVGETFNWVDEVSVELTARMLATLFGFPYADRRKLVYWSDIITNVNELTDGQGADPAEREAALRECFMAFYQLWAERAAAPPGPDLVSMLVHGAGTSRMNENPAQFMGNIMLLIVGGNDTTRNSISAGVAALNQFPDEYAKLRADRGLIPNMVAEMVRWQTPVIHMRRTALRDIELGGQTIRKHDKVVMWYVSGNRDEAVFADADRLQVDRPNARQHVSFGYGIHRCMGNRLAEMQLRVLWEEIMKRFRQVEVVGDIERVPNVLIRGIRTLPVVVHPW